MLLLDEPYQGFDGGTYVDFWKQVDGWRERRIGVAVVTHMLTELWRVDRVVELTRTGGPLGGGVMTAAWRTVAQMQARDLVRRRAALLLLVALPMSWYLAETAAGVDYAVGTGVLAMAWSAAAAPLFAFVGARDVDQRLIQAGYQARDIVVGRLLALIGLSTTIAVVLGIVMVIGSRPDRNRETSFSRSPWPPLYRLRSAG